MIRQFFLVNLLMMGIGKVISVDRPEMVLLNVLTQPLVFDESTTSPECHRDSEIYRVALKNYSSWALQMYDSSAKIPSGVITGNIKQLGNYDECLQVKSVQGFNGKACSGTVTFKVSKESGSDFSELDISDLLNSVISAAGLSSWSGNSVDYEWLWCIPSSCNYKDFEVALRSTLKPLNIRNQSLYNVTVGKNDCHTLESDHAVFLLADWLYISVMVLCAMLVLVSTTYDVVRSSGTEKPDFKGLRHSLLTSFSIYTNGKFLLSTKQSGNTIRCLDGLRFLSICWIIYGHTCYQEIISPQLDLSHVQKMHESWPNMLILNGNIATDIFFLLSGILLMYSELGRKEKDSQNYHLNIKMLYFHRYLRLTPAYAAVIGFYATLLHKTGSGPNWDRTIGQNQDYCVENWWTNLLYINNYVGVGKFCMSQSWYLAVDMQLVWISPIFLYPLVTCGIRHIASITVLSVGLGVAVFSPLFVTYFEHLYGTMIYYSINMKELADVYTQIYIRVYARAGPYIIGLILGYYIRKVRSNPPKVSTLMVVCGWTLAIIVGPIVLFAPRQMYFQDYKYNPVEAALYAGFHRSIFALAVGWIIFATVLGRAGFVGNFLSWSGFMPLGKLTYSAYLTHFIILLYDTGSMRTPAHLSLFENTRNFMGSLGLTMFLALILCIFLEIPFLRLDRLLTRRREHRLFSRGSFKPPMGAFGSCDSTKEIYRSSDDVASTISRVYEESISNRDNDTPAQGTSSNDYYLHYN